jgi:ABC-type branched-subunit amino acid transport system substrate-binding protein
MQFKGGRILGIDSILSTNLSGIADVAARIEAAHPDVVFYAGASNAAGPLKAQLDALGYVGPFIGSEGIANDPNFVVVVGINSANGTLAIGPYSDPSSFTSGATAKFVRAFHARYPGKALPPDGAEHYDAAMVLITAMRHLIQAGEPVTRQAMIEQVQHIQYAGAIGPISFDSNGDIAHGAFSVYVVRDGTWTYTQQLTT